MRSAALIESVAGWSARARSAMADAPALRYHHQERGPFAIISRTANGRATKLMVLRLIDRRLRYDVGLARVSSSCHPNVCPRRPPRHDFSSLWYLAGSRVRGLMPKLC